VIVCVTLKPFADYANAPINCRFIFYLFVWFQQRRFVISDWDCRNGQGFACQCNYQIRKAVETAGDIDVLLLDKTGTITERKATNFLSSKGISKTILSNQQFWVRWLMTRPKAKVLWNWQIEVANKLLKVLLNQIYRRNQNQRCCFKRRNRY
jgi:K+-transporting ATPase ATPase B chain